MYAFLSILSGCFCIFCVGCLILFSSTFALNSFIGFSHKFSFSDLAVINNPAHVDTSLYGNMESKAHLKATCCQKCPLMVCVQDFSLQHVTSKGTSS